MSERWTEKEVQILREHHPELPNKALAQEYLEDRTWQAIEGKIKRLKLEEKEKGANFRWKLKNTSTPKKDSSYEAFLLGLFCGDGSFMITEQEQSTKFAFRLEMKKPGNEELFKEIQEYLQAGSINTYERRTGQVILFVIQSIPEHVSTTIPLMERTPSPTSTHKRKQYSNWREPARVY